MPRKRPAGRHRGLQHRGDYGLRPKAALGGSASTKPSPSTSPTPALPRPARRSSTTPQAGARAGGSPRRGRGPVSRHAHHARPGDRRGIPAAAVHHADTRPHHQPHLRSGGRGRRPAYGAAAARQSPSADRNRATREILARDAAPESATTLQRQQQDPAGRLGAAAARYLDALHLAAAASHEMSAVDHAAVFRSQILTAIALGSGGPMPWLPGIPDRLAADPNWGPYLHARSHLVAQLADQVRLNAAAELPAWAAKLQTPLPAELIADVQVWRAAIQLDPSDLRPTGPPQHSYAGRIWQQQLDKRLAATDSRTDRDLRRLLATEVPNTARPIPAGTGRQAAQPRPSRPRRRPRRSDGARRRTPTRRPPSRSSLVAHPRSATPANAESGLCPRRGSPSDQAYDHDVTRAAAAHASPGAAARAWPQPLKCGKRHGDAFRQSPSPRHVYSRQYCAVTLPCHYRATNGARHCHTAPSDGKHLRKSEAISSYH